MARYEVSQIRKLGLLALLSLLLSACGGDIADQIEDGIPLAATAVDQINEVVEGEPGFEGESFEEAELPEEFPASFPIPADARIGSTVGMGEEDEFRVFLSLTTPLSDSLAYYRSELANKGWFIDEEETTGRGVEMAIRSDVYEGELLFVEAEMGVALDVHLFPTGTGEEIPGMPPGLGEGTTLGEGTSSFPADFPLPSSYTPIELNDTLRAEGYELAFTYVGITEMGMVDFTIALMTAGWEIGDMALEGMSGVYVVPFTSPDSSIEGYAYITSDPGQFGLDTGGAVLIALAPGSP